MFLHHHFRFCQGILPVALVEIDSSQQSIGRNLVEAVGVALVPGSHLQTGLCLLNVGNHLLVNLLHAAAGEHVVDICLQRKRNAAGGSRIAMGIGIGIEIDEQEVAVGSHHIGLAYQLTDFILCSLGNLVLILDDVVGDVDGMIVTAPAERSRGALLVEVVPCPDVEVRIVILGRGGCLAQGHLVASQRGESTVFREILVFVGEQGYESGNTISEVTPTLLRETVSKSTSDALKQYMYSTVTGGTAVTAKVDGYSMGGKTGTAQKAGRDGVNYLVSFIGFAPVEDPQLVIYCVVDEPNVAEQFHSTYAQNIVREILEEVLPYMNIYRDEDTTGIHEGWGIKGEDEGDVGDVTAADVANSTAEESLDVPDTTDELPENTGEQPAEDIDP